MTRFDYAGDPAEVVIDMSNSSRGKPASIVGLNDASASIQSRLQGHLTTSH